MAKTWKNSIEYQRILEILHDYWLSEPDEKLVTVSMYFEHADGQTQEKQITWRNPKSTDPEGPCFMTMREILDEDNSHGWTSVNDRLPKEHYRRCLVIKNGMRPSVDIAIWLMGEWEETEIDGDGYIRRLNITDQVDAWMPLPEIPKKFDTLSGGE